MADDVTVVTDQPAQTEDREDWKARAIRAETQVELVQQAPPPTPSAPAPPDPLEQIDAEIQQLRDNMPEISASNPNAFWEAEEKKEQIRSLEMKRIRAESDRKFEQLNQSFLGDRTKTMQNNYKARFSGDPVFQAIQNDFDAAVAKVDPSARDENAFELIRKTLSYNYLTEGQGQQGPVGGAGGAAGVPATRGQPNTQPAKPQLSDKQKEIAAFYGMSEEEYVDPKYNDVPLTGEYEGIPIMDIPPRMRNRVIA